MIGDDIVVMGRRAVARSYAKINLTLDVTGKRDDGYHEVEMIMQTLSLFDLVIADKTRGGIHLSTNLHYLPSNEKNIAYKAARLFFDETGIRGGVKLRIHKNIPVSAGLAGGSGNAAAVLVLLNSEKELCSLGAKLGADVPYCITGGTQLSSGIGDVLSPLPPMPKLNILLVKPFINVSTAEVYKEIDSAVITRRPDTAAMTAAIERGDARAVAGNLCNVMEYVTERQYPVISDIKSKMKADGALGALMSGSGPSVFGIFEDYETAFRSAAGFLRSFRDVFVVKTYN